MKNFKKLFTPFIFILFLSLFVIEASVIYASSGDLERISMNSNGDSLASSISSDGRYVAFMSMSNNLILGDTNSVGDIFVFDRTSGIVERVSVDNNGVQGNLASSNPIISDNGRYVAFFSNANNLVPDDTNGKADVFVRDRFEGKTLRVSISSAGVQGNQVDGIQAIDMSGDGRYVVFATDATNLVSGDTNGQADVFMYDLIVGSTERVSVDSSRNQALGGWSASPSISSDGRYVSFGSTASNLVSGDTNSVADIFLHDRMTGLTERISVDSDGNQSNNHNAVTRTGVSSDGRYVVFDSYASNLVQNDTNWRDVFVRDRVERITKLVTVNSLGVQANQDATSPSISDDGRYVVFTSTATNLVSSDNNGFPDVFIRDLEVNKTHIVSIRVDGVQGNGNSFSAALTAHGEKVSFTSSASNLIPGDTNNVSDIFLKTILVPNQSPYASAGLDLVGNEGQSLTFNGSGSSDPDGAEDIVSYNWDFGDGSAASGAVVNHTYLDNGIYTTTLTVTDSAGATSSDTANVTVNNVAPSIGSINPVNSVLPGIQINTGTSFSDVGVLDTHTATWNWGDGNTSSGIVSETNGSGTVTGSHTYSAPGIYTITLVVDDGIDSSSSSIAVTILTPVAAIGNLVNQVEIFNLQQGIANSLDAKLDAAVGALDDINVNNNQAAINSLQAFINAVEAQRGSKITNAQADLLISSAQAIINYLNQ